jgi:hypothetical protein
MNREDCKCKCGCGLDINKEMFDKILLAEQSSGIKFRVNSGARCVNHNKNEKGSPTSTHIKGLAIDVGVATDRERSIVVKAMLKAGITRIGIAKTFVHGDIDTTKSANIIWIY